MKIVCDSGSTKADWSVFKKGQEVITYSTRGINPVFHDKSFILSELNKEIIGELDVAEIHEIFYYGAGCWDKNLKGIISNALGEVFPRSNIEVHHDLLGAARAACGNSPGVACILGTGSNSCLYDGKNVIDNVKNLGYLVGDEGSGSHLGKEILRSYFYRELPKDLIEPFEELVPNGKSGVLENIYQKDNPNVYLASFSRFLSDYKKHFFVQELVYDSFVDFLNRHVCKYKGHLEIPISFIGSVAFHFSDILKIALERKNMELGKIVRKPINELVRYHQN